MGVSKAREYEAAHDGSHVTFVSNNAYENTPESLGECFERNREGMLKNMAIHELALLVSFYDVSVETIEKCEADKEFSSKQTLKGPSGNDFTDFARSNLPSPLRVERALASKLIDVVEMFRTLRSPMPVERKSSDTPCLTKKIKPTLASCKRSTLVRCRTFSPKIPITLRLRNVWHPSALMERRLRASPRLTLASKLYEWPNT